MSKSVLMVYGGWPGHDPTETSHLFRRSSERSGLKGHHVGVPGQLSRWRLDGIDRYGGADLYDEQHYR